MGLGTDFGISGGGYFVYVYTDAPNGTRYVLLNRSNGQIEERGTNATTILQQAIDLACANGVPLEVGAGSYPITSTLFATSVTGLVLRGAGASITAAPGVGGSGTSAYSSLGTRFVWQGASATTPLFSFGDLRSSILGNFAIGCSSTYPLFSGIDLYSLGSSAARGAGTTPTRNLLSRVSMDGVNGYLKHGVRWPSASSHNPPTDVADTNNDFTTCEYIEVANHGNVAYEVGHSQAYSQLFFQCTASGAADLSGQAGISFGAFYSGSAWTGTTGGTAHWIGGAMSRHQEADIVFGTPQASACIFDGLNSETSKRLVSFPSTGSTTGLNNGGPLILRGLRWTADAAHADGFVIDYHAPGPLILEGCYIKDDGVGHDLKLRLVAGNASKQTIYVRPCVIESTASDDDLYDTAGANGANTLVVVEAGSVRKDLSNSSVITRWTAE